MTGETLGANYDAQPPVDVDPLEGVPFTFVRGHNSELHKIYFGSTEEINFVNANVIRQLNN